DREAVAQVHGPGRVESFVQVLSEFDARLGSQEALPRRAAIRGESEGRPAQGAGNIDAVTRLRSTAQQRLTARHGSGADDVAGDMRGACEVTAGKDDSVRFGQFQQSGVEAVDPFGGSGL